MREKPIMREPRFGTLEIQRVFAETRRGPCRKPRQTELRLVEVWGWPTPIPWNARMEFPPLPRKPVYGPAAREEARRIMREAKREGINFGWPTKTSLCKVAKGERPLSFALCNQVREYLARKRAEREVIRQPLRFQLGRGGPRVLWRTLEPPTTLPPSWWRPMS
jgi:hypothetical protein